MAIIGRVRGYGIGGANTCFVCRVGNRIPGTILAPMFQLRRFVHPYFVAGAFTFLCGRVVLHVLGGTLHAFSRPTTYRLPIRGAVVCICKSPLLVPWLARTLIRVSVRLVTPNRTLYAAIKISVFTPPDVAHIIFLTFAGLTPREIATKRFYPDRTIVSGVGAKISGIGVLVTLGVCV